MSISSSFSGDGKVFTMYIEGDFNFSYLHPFRKEYIDNDAVSAEKIIVDLRNTVSVDSSALGMLLNMQSDLKKDDCEIRIINCNDVVTKIFNITNFSKKFIVE